jgi:hypothetical protein
MDGSRSEMYGDNLAKFVEAHTPGNFIVTAEQLRKVYKKHSLRWDERLLRDGDAIAKFYNHYFQNGCLIFAANISYREKLFPIDCAGGDEFAQIDKALKKEGLLEQRVPLPERIVERYVGSKVPFRAFASEIKELVCPSIYKLPCNDWGWMFLPEITEIVGAKTNQEALDRYWALSKNAQEGFLTMTSHGGNAHDVPISEDLIWADWAFVPAGWGTAAIAAHKKGYHSVTLEKILFSLDKPDKSEWLKIVSSTDNDEPRAFWVAVGHK